MHLLLSNTKHVPCDYNYLEKFINQMSNDWYRGIKKMSNRFFPKQT